MTNFLTTMIEAFSRPSAQDPGVYMADNCYLVTDVSWMRTNFGNRALSLAGTRLWISLSLDSRYSHLRQLLKTFLFGQWDQTAV